MPKDVKHHGGWEHRDIHNIYGALMIAATYKGQLLRSNNRLRPYILTRSFFVGSQKYSSVWTGDNTAEWPHLRASVPMLLSLSVAGIPHVGADVGGFFKNVDEQLLVRWYQAGAFQPFFRAHAHIDCKRREPWLYSDNAKNAIRSAIRRRYALLPYWYTLFYEHSKTGSLVMQPLWAQFPEDESSFDEEREWLVGPGLLVRPVMEPDVTSVSCICLEEVRLGTSGTQTECMFLQELYIERARRASKLMRDDPVTLYIASELNKEFANGTLYMDDGETFKYEAGEYLYWSFTYKQQSEVLYTIVSKNLDINGTFDPDVYVEKIVIRGVRYYPRNIHLYYDDYNPVDLEFTHDRDLRLVVIRKPGAYVSREWRIDIHT
uniref:DUF5110 domain-containing protein n=1 Tax=Ditylenchus dipsaci TaxID=166011 RepID=A0A915D3K3_9BILA